MIFHSYVNVYQRVLTMIPVRENSEVGDGTLCLLEAGGSVVIAAIRLTSNFPTCDAIHTNKGYQYTTIEICIIIYLITFEYIQL